MPLETATFITGLDETNPVGTDTKSQGDNHLKLIKSVLKNTLPNANAPITATPAQINNSAAPTVTDISNVSATITWNLSANPRAKLTLDGNKTLLATGLVVGTYYLRVYQGVTARTITWNVAYKMPGRSGGFPPDLGVNGDYTDLVCIYDGVSLSVNYNMF